MTVTAADVGQALVIVWRVFRRAAGDDIAGWIWPAPQPKCSRAGSPTGYRRKSPESGDAADAFPQDGYRAIAENPASCDTDGTMAGLALCPALDPCSQYRTGCACDRSHHRHRGGPDRAGRAVVLIALAIVSIRPALLGVLPNGVLQPKILKVVPGLAGGCGGAGGRATAIRDAILAARRNGADVEKALHQAIAAGIPPHQDACFNKAR